MSDKKDVKLKVFMFEDQRMEKEKINNLWFDCIDINNPVVQGLLGIAILSHHFRELRNAWRFQALERENINEEY